MSMPPPPDGVPGWPSPGSGPSQEFLAALQAEMERRAAEAATGTPDPMSPMDALYVTAHTMFQSAVRGGFTERQAIILVAEIMTRQ